MELTRALATAILTCSVLPPRAFARWLLRREVFLPSELGRARGCGTSVYARRDEVHYPPYCPVRSRTGCGTSHRLPWALGEPCLLQSISSTRHFSPTPTLTFGGPSGCTVNLKASRATGTWPVARLRAGSRHSR